MPSIVASHLGIKGVVVATGANVVGTVTDANKAGTADEMGGANIAHIKAFEKQPRGGLTTFAKLTEESKWLRSRNSLLKDFGNDGRMRVLICEGGVCKEDGSVDVKGLEETTASISIGEAKPESKTESG